MPLGSKTSTTGCQKVEDIKGEGTPCTHPVSHRCPLLVPAARRGDLCQDLIHLLPSSYVKWTVQKSWSVLGSQGKAKLSRSIWSESQCCKSQVKDQRIRENKKAAEETTRRPWINPRQVRSLLGVTGALAQGMTESPKYRTKTSQKHLESSEADVRNVSWNCKVSSRCRERQAAA